jgi:hypothetical protein
VLGVVTLQAGLTLVVAGLFAFLVFDAVVASTLTAAGVGLVALGALLPARLQRVAPPASLLDAFAPEWQFAERHERVVAAPPARVYRALRELEAREIRFFHLLTWLRRFGRPLPPGILNPPDGVPLIDAAVRGGFVLLGEDAPREIVVGMVVVGRDRVGAPLSPAVYQALSGPGFAKGTMSFHVAPAGAGSRVVTETRVHATSGDARRSFGVYWRIIQPGSAFIRRMWLRAIARRAEGGEAS